MAVYLDNAATSYPKPECVYDGVMEFMRGNGASPGRGNYARAQEADRLVYDTRKSICRLLGGGRPGQVVFTCNATESINLVLKGYLGEGDKVLTTPYEHNAMWRPLKTLERDRNISIETIPAGPDGSLDLDWLRERLREKIRLVAVAHGSNVLGCITPLAEVTALAREQGVAVLVDAAQTAGVYPIDLAKIPVDFFAFTGHKGLLGPTGTGGLWLRQGVELPSFKEGGTGGMSSLPFMPPDPPDRYEAGTMNISGLAGLYASVRFLLETGVEQVRRHEADLMELLLDGLRAIPGLSFSGPVSAANRLGLVSFNLAGQDPQKVAMGLDEKYGIMVRAGLHCAPQAHRLTGTDPAGAVRASLSFFTEQNDVEQLIYALTELAK